MRNMVFRLKWAARTLKFTPCFLFRDKYLQNNWICQDLYEYTPSIKIRLANTVRCMPSGIKSGQYKHVRYMIHMTGFASRTDS